MDMIFAMLRRFLASSVLLVLITGCGQSSEVQEIEAKAQRLVSARATTNDVALKFASKPLHIYTQAYAKEQIKRVNPADVSHRFWQRVLEYPETHSFPLPGGEILIFFDDSGRATAFYSNIQL